MRHLSVQFCILQYFKLHIQECASVIFSIILHEARHKIIVLLLSVVLGASNECITQASQKYAFWDCTQARATEIIPCNLTRCAGDSCSHYSLRSTRI
jgi:hypothetical protein